MARNPLEKKLILWSWSCSQLLSLTLTMLDMQVSWLNLGAFHCPQCLNGCTKMHKRVGLLIGVWAKSHLRTCLLEWSTRTRVTAKQRSKQHELCYLFIFLQCLDWIALLSDTLYIINTSAFALYCHVRIVAHLDISKLQVAIPNSDSSHQRFQIGNIMQTPAIKQSRTFYLSGAREEENRNKCISSETDTFAIFSAKNIHTLVNHVGKSQSNLFIIETKMISHH